MNLGKPLPKPPPSPALRELLQASYGTSSKPKAGPTTSWPPVGGGISKGLDLRQDRTISKGSRSASADMTSTELHYGGPGRRDGEDDTRDVLTPRSNGPTSAGSPAQRSGGQAVGTAGGSTHLSGLMCNVHRTTGREPYPLVGASTTILGDKLYVFGGRILSRTRPALTADLFELDLIRRHWTRVEALGDIPPPRYFHSMCPLGDTKLVCYGGMSPATSLGEATQASQGADSQPEVVVMSDIHIFDVHTKAWSHVQTQNTPQGRYAHCATILPSSGAFSSANAPTSALQHNPSGPQPNSGTLGVNIDGSGGAEMVVVGGQDSANHYIEQISVFNLRSLTWTSMQPLGKQCGAYRSVVAPVPAYVTSRIGKGSSMNGVGHEPKESGSSMLIYSNYNFLDVKLELQIRMADGSLSEKPMQGTYSPPGLRFPNGGVIDTNFVVSGTYLTSSKQEYALWALDLRSLTWSRIDAGGNVFSQGSWNRGVLWNRQNTFVILGNRKRSLVEDYNHRRINFTNVCMVELEAFGLYDNPRKVAPMSGFVSASSPFSMTLSPTSKAGWNTGGRTLSRAAEELGQMALSTREMADMDILCIGGERTPVNSRIIARRWGPYFVQLLREGAASQEGNDTATVRPDLQRQNPSRNSSVTITPSLGSQTTNFSNTTTLNNSIPPVDLSALALPPDTTTVPPSRPRTLYLPHTHLTLQSLLHFLYTSSLPPSTSPLCTPQILCSLLQLARPYRIDGLLEAVVERLHSVLDSRNAAAVFNASAMAAGGGRSTSRTEDISSDHWLYGAGAEGVNGSNGSMHSGSPSDLSITIGALSSDLASSSRPLTQIHAPSGGLKINTQVGNLSTGQHKDDDDPVSATSTASDVSGSDVSSFAGNAEEGDGQGQAGRGRRQEKEWKGSVSAVIGLQKRGLRGLMEGRRLRERGGSLGMHGGLAANAAGQTSQQARVGLGIGGSG